MEKIVDPAVSNILSCKVCYVSVCISVCLSGMHLKTVEPILTKFGRYVSYHPGVVLDWFISQKSQRFLTDNN